MSPRLHVAGQSAACAPLDVVSMLRCRMGRVAPSAYAAGEHVALQHGATTTATGRLRGGRDMSPRAP